MNHAILRVMSFNVRGCISKDGDNIWPSRAGLNVRTIRKYAPDIIGFQEVQQGNWETYEQTLTEYAKVQGPPYNNLEPNYAYPSIFYRPEKYDLCSQDAFWISPTPECHSMGWDTNCVRSALTVVLRCKQTDKELVVVNTHLDHRGPQARLEGARLICQRLADHADQGRTILVTGDFNCQPSTGPHEAFIQAGYRDSYNEAGLHDGPDAYSFHAFTGTSVAKPTKGRIDWIMHRAGDLRLNAVQARIIVDAEPPLYPSDHYPVQTEFTVA